MRKIIAILAILSFLGVSGAVVITKHINEAKKVEIMSASVQKSKVHIKEINIKKGTKYCAVKVKHSKTNIIVDIPSPTNTCDIIKVGQKIKLESNKLNLNK